MQWVDYYLVVGNVSFQFGITQCDERVHAKTVRVRIDGQNGTGRTVSAVAAPQAADERVILIDDFEQRL